MTILRPSGSDTDQLLGCTFPYGHDIERETSDVAEFGVESHAIFARLITDRFTKAVLGPAGWEPTEETKRIERLAKRHTPHDTPTTRAWKGFQAFLDWHKDWADKIGLLTFIETESPYAINLYFKEDAGVRKIKSADPKTHEYPGLLDDEFPMTLDFLGVISAVNGPRTPRVIYVLDFKTGKDTPTPASSGQLRSQALAAGLYHNATEAVIGFVHAPEDGDPYVITDRISIAKLEKTHLRALRKAWRRLGDGSIRPWTQALGDKLGIPQNWCTTCKVRSACPVSSRDLVVGAAEALGSTVGIKGTEIVNNIAGGKIIPRTRLGEIIAMRSAMDKISKELGPMLQADIEAHGPAEFRGKVYTVETTAPFEAVSKASIMRALGVVRGEKELDRLRKLGCLEERTSTRIQPRNAE